MLAGRNHTDCIEKELTIMLRIHLQKLAILAIVLSIFALPATAAEKTVKVFILAGQSNMEGKAKNELLDHQATDSKTNKLFAHLRKDNKWIVRDDVFIKYWARPSTRPS